MSQPLIYGLGYRPVESVGIGERVFLSRTVIVAEHLFGDVALKMERLNRNVGALQASFQQAPEVLDSVGVNLAALHSAD